jgi:hypothetical protein
MFQLETTHDEELRPIPGWEGLYSVSRTGVVHSLPRPALINGGRIRLHLGGVVKHGRDGHGYPAVTLSGKGRRQSVMVHRCVALAWMPHPASDSLDINHIDGNRQNPRLENLEWCSRSENHKHAWRTGLRVSTPAMKANSVRMGRSNRKLNFEQAEQARAQVAAGATLLAVANALGCSQSAIFKIVHNKSYVTA